MPVILDPSAPNEARDNWPRQPGSDRPIYMCPKCGEMAMQFFRILPETSQSAERNNSFVCFACGRSWAMS